MFRGGGRHQYSRPSGHYRTSQSTFYNSTPSGSSCFATIFLPLCNHQSRVEGELLSETFLPSPFCQRKHCHHHRSHGTPQKRLPFAALVLLLWQRAEERESNEEEAFSLLLPPLSSLRLQPSNCSPKSYPAEAEEWGEEGSAATHKTRREAGGRTRKMGTEELLFSLVWSRPEEEEEESAQASVSAVDGGRRNGRRAEGKSRRESGRKKRREKTARRRRGEGVRSFLPLSQFVAPFLRPPPLPPVHQASFACFPRSFLSPRAEAVVDSREKGEGTPASLPLRGRGGRGDGYCGCGGRSIRVHPASFSPLLPVWLRCTTTHGEGAKGNVEYDHNPPPPSSLPLLPDPGKLRTEGEGGMKAERGMVREEEGGGKASDILSLFRAAFHLSFATSPLLRIL